MWRGCCRLNISVAAPLVWRCLSGSAVAPFPHSAHRTGQADLPHPALGQDFTPSPTAGCVAIVDPDNAKLLQEYKWYVRGRRDHVFNARSGRYRKEIGESD